MTIARRVHKSELNSSPPSAFTLSTILCILVEDLTIQTEAQDPIYAVPKFKPQVVVVGLGVELSRVPHETVMVKRIRFEDSLQDTFTRHDRLE